MIPISFLFNQIWDNEVTMSRVSQPILFLSSKKDQVIPPKHMKDLFEIANKNVITDRKLKFAEFENGNHNNTYHQDGYFVEIKNFLNDVL